jgi:hypothetical protein
LKALFLGHCELFKDLDIDRAWDCSLNKYPVVKLDFSFLSEELCSLLIEQGKQYGLNFGFLASSLGNLNAEEGRNATFVILIDEYDKPVIDALALGSPILMSTNLNILNYFLQLVKASSSVFSLVTGSSRLTRLERQYPKRYFV